MVMRVHLLGLEDMANTDVTADDVPEAADAENQSAGDEEGEGGKGRPSKKVLIMAAAGGLLLLGGLGAGAGYFFGWFGGNETAEEAALEAALEAAAEPVFYFDMPEITVNLSSAEQRAQYLRMTVALEISDPEISNILEPNLPRITDVFQTYLRELRVSDLEGSAGLFRLRHELQRRINLAIFPAEVDAVLFREIIVQ